MKKIIQWLTGGVIKEVGDVIDKLTTTEEERLEVKKQIQQILEDADNKAQEEVSKRWEADMQGNWLTRSIRPLTLAFLMVVLTTFTLVDFGFVDMDIKDSWIDLWQILAITCFGAYFGGRSYEKIKK